MAYFLKFIWEKKLKNKKIVLLSLVVLVSIFAGARYMYNINESKELTAIAKNKASVFKRDYSYTQGDNNAKVQLVEFFDPACETCAQFHPYIKDIMKENKGNIQLVLRYAPLHPGSDQVVKMLEATKKQGLFMKTLEMTFATQKYWASHNQPNLNALWKALPSVGLDMEQLIKDMKDPKLNEIVAQEIADAKTLGATKTPSYYVNGKPLQKFGLKELKELINSEL
jgi:protein-disulfide isomerase